MYFLAESFLRSIRSRGDDDFVDRLNSYYTAMALGICCLVVSAKQYVGRPIECWVPKMFSTSMEQYIEAYCWIQNTYYVPMHKHITDDVTKRKAKEISYYQWVPFVLLFQALMFTLPNILWRLSNWQTGINLHHLINAAVEVHGLKEDRQLSIANIVIEIQSVLDIQAGITDPRNVVQGFTLRSRFSLWRRYHGCYVTVLYLLIKILFVLNVAMQFVGLNWFLKNENYSFYGFEVLRDLMNGREWSDSGHFPRVTLCDFKVRFVANLNKYTVQCALLINLLNEKVFAMIWLWFLVLLTVTTCSLIFWWFNVMLGFQRYAFVLRYLHIAAVSEAQQQRRQGTYNKNFVVPSEVYERFVHFYLKTDGVFTLRMIANHAGDVVTMEIVKQLWHEFRTGYYFIGTEEGDYYTTSTVQEVLWRIIFNCALYFHSNIEEDRTDPDYRQRTFI